jgi:hypothetical protein
MVNDANEASTPRNVARLHRLAATVALEADPALRYDAIAS